MKTSILLFFSLFAIGLKAKTNFTCSLSVIPQHADYQEIYTVHGDQNPVQVTYDFKGSNEQIHYFNVDTFGKIVKGLVPTTDSENHFVRLKFKRVIPPNDLPDPLPPGVRIVLDAGKRSTYAGLGMRDTYKTYIQDVTGELADGRKALVVLTCAR